MASSQPQQPPEVTGERDDYLSRLGERVREERARRGMTRRILARDSGLSERYLAQLESGKGNISIKLLRRVCQAMNLSLPRLLGGEPTESAELQRILELLAEKREAFDEYARRSDMANVTPDAVDTGSETELRRQIVAAEQKRLKAA